MSTTLLGDWSRPSFAGHRGRALHKIEKDLEPVLGKGWLTRAGYSVRDAAALVGLTTGRISQLTTITTTTKRVKAKPSKSKKAAFTKIKPVRAAAAASSQRRRSPASGVL